MESAGDLENAREYYRRAVIIAHDREYIDALDNVERLLDSKASA